MYVINRSIAVIRPKQPLVDWVNAISNSKQVYTLAEVNRECLAFLMPLYVTEADGEEEFKKVCSDIFVAALSRRCTDETQWPGERSYEKFREWFDVEFHSMVLDPFEDDIRKEPYEYVSTAPFRPRG